MLLLTITLSIIAAAFILYHQKKRNELQYSLYFIKGLLLGFATGSEDAEDAIDGKIEHHFQIGFGFLVFTMTWLEDAE
jgi:uncharacterized membrane protein